MHADDVPRGKRVSCDPAPSIHDTHLPARDLQQLQTHFLYPTETQSTLIFDSSATNLASFTFPPSTSHVPMGSLPQSTSKITPRSPPPLSIHETTSSPATTAPFTFGTFRMNEPTPNVMGTPTAELGPFEYPVMDGGFAVGGGVMSPAMRRLVEDEQVTGTTSAHSLMPPGFTPSLRRTSSTSTVPISPAGGRRPSVVHSNTVPQADAGRKFSLAGDGEGLGPHSASAVVAAVDREERLLREGEPDKGHVGQDVGLRRTSAASAGGTFVGPSSSGPTSSLSGRRPSILAFAHQPLPDTPIPPSLAHLASTFRRGSIPANQLFPVNMPPRDRQSSVSSISSMRSSISSASGTTAAVARNSLSGPVFMNPGTRDEHMTVSSAYLYQRRSSLASTSRGLLSSKAPIPSMGRPAFLSNQQRTGSMSSTTSSNPSSSSGSRESVVTLRDLRESSQGQEWHSRRPSFPRQGDSNESTSTERNRRMSMPALSSPSPSANGNENEALHWPPQTQPRSINTALPDTSTESSKFSFPPQVSTTYVSSRPFKLGKPPSPRLHASEGFQRHRTESATSSSSSSSSVDFVASEEDSGGSSSVASSKDLSDVPGGSPNTPSRRTFRMSPRGIQARERRRSSRMSALIAAAGNSLETIPSDNVVDFSVTNRSNTTRSSFSSPNMSSPGLRHHQHETRPSKILAKSDNGMSAEYSAFGHHERSALSTSSSEEGPEDGGLSSENEERGNQAPTSDGEDEGTEISTAFRAFAFPARNSIGSAQGSTDLR